MRLTLRASLRRSARVGADRRARVGGVRVCAARPRLPMGRPVRARARRRRRRGAAAGSSRPAGQAIQSARPITLSSGTMPPPGSPRWSRESRGVAAVVAHDPQAARRARRCRTGPGRARCPGSRYALVERPAVDGDPALLVAADHAVAPDADDPLDEVGPADRAPASRRSSLASNDRSRRPRRRVRTRRSGTPTCSPAPGRRSAACSPSSRWGSGRAAPRRGSPAAARQRRRRAAAAPPATPARRAARVTTQRDRSSGPPRRLRGSGRAPCSLLRCPSGRKLIRPVQVDASSDQLSRFSLILAVLPRRSRR